MDLLQLNDIIKSSKNILIMSHINPDGDTLGTMCALYSAILDNCKKKADMLLMSKLPEIYKFIPYVNFAKHISKYDKSREYDLVINVDVASYDRMFESEVFFKKAKKTINIDHHVTNENYADFNYVVPEASSAGEVLYDVLDGLNWKISKNTAEALYVAILTDTGSFRYSNTSGKALNTVAKLIDLGVSPVETYKQCYETYTKNHVLFQSLCMTNAIFTENDKIAYIVVYKKDIEKYNVEDDCTEGLSEKLRAINTVEVAFVAKQISANVTKISLRSERIDISQVCVKFGGGGHKLAAGCVIKAEPNEAAERIVKELKKIIE